MCDPILHSESDNRKGKQVMKLLKLKSYESMIKILDLYILKAQIIETLYTNIFE